MTPTRLSMTPKRPLHQSLLLPKLNFLPRKQYQDQQQQQQQQQQQRQHLQRLKKSQRSKRNLLMREARWLLIPPQAKYGAKPTTKWTSPPPKQQRSRSSTSLQRTWQSSPARFRRTSKSPRQRPDLEKAARRPRCSSKAIPNSTRSCWSCDKAKCTSSSTRGRLPCRTRTCCGFAIGWTSSSHKWCGTIRTSATAAPTWICRTMSSGRRAWTRCSGCSEPTESHVLS
mmetsp:Transcript_37837/g.81932  ORF Transcript_37837/g.81932 Transcript_37837/m.81932 type:complete len:227 (+) Transcript_37837:195-875(+)